MKEPKQIDTRQPSHEETFQPHALRLWKQSGKSTEAFWSTLRQELLYRNLSSTSEEATTSIFDYIESFYNRIRVHSAYGLKSSLAYATDIN